MCCWKNLYHLEWKWYGVTSTPKKWDFGTIQWFFRKFLNEQFLSILDGTFSLLCLGLNGWSLVSICPSCLLTLPRLTLTQHWVDWHSLVRWCTCENISCINHLITNIESASCQSKCKRTKNKNCRKKMLVIWIQIMYTKGISSRLSINT